MTNLIILLILAAILTWGWPRLWRWLMPSRPVQPLSYWIGFAVGYAWETVFGRRQPTAVDVAELQRRVEVAELERLYKRSAAVKVRRS